jgi:D-glycero-alpha-D-manno-heptose-7-phosphate kinase
MSDPLPATGPGLRAPIPSYTATAPVRIDLAGGWTDVAPFSEREGGLVVSAAISRRVTAMLEPGKEGMLIFAEDLQQAAKINRASDLDAMGDLQLHRAALRMYPVGPGTLRTKSEVPLGSGLGSSGALDVALIAALTAARGEPLTAIEIAAEAFRLEAVEAGIPGGKQDQYAAALGGINCFTFRGEDVGIEPCTLDPAFLEEFERRLVVCYTGSSRLSGDTIHRVMQAYEGGNETVTGALRELTEVAYRMNLALREANMREVGRLLSVNWAAQRRLDARMATTTMDALEAEMRAAGALGGKAAGSGAGGCMFFLAGGDPEVLRDVARRTGAKVLEATISRTGVEVC